MVPNFAELKTKQIQKIQLNPISHGVFDHDIFMGGGLKDPQPKTGLNLVR